VMESRKLATFGHHPDYVTDLEIEAEIIQGEVYECLVGMRPHAEVSKRLWEACGVINSSGSYYFGERGQKAKQIIRAERMKIIDAWGLSN
jgi:hypothetical protein